MSGHNKWSTIKHKKGKADAQRGRLFTRLIKEISVAAREGGGDPEGNPRLRTAILNARQSNMPTDNIDRAIKKGTGELPGVTYDEVVYEGYGPGGVALYLEVLTDNKNRTVAEIRHLIGKYGGNLGENGSVAWMFDRKGMIHVPADEVTEDDVLMAVMDADAEDVKDEGESFVVITGVENFEEIKKALEKNGIKYSESALEMIPKTMTQISGKHASSLIKLLERLEDHEDVQHIFSNFDMSEEELAALTSR
ncbi:MAG: YebC/PmpR family DNA-binding transcriptional regulator [Candidatus Cloacimonetes bacterium 4572_55]|nr:MAG: YebC/PmpR family DNA-binding transcriptional regulator [Candidatus Cloacimonetes bacterium 4572_55]